MFKVVNEYPEPVRVKPEFEFEAPDMSTTALANCEVVRVTPVKVFQSFMATSIDELSVDVKVPPAMVLFEAEISRRVAELSDVVIARPPSAFWEPEM